MKPIALSLVISTLTIAPVISLTGCSSWPDAGVGGDAQVDTSHVYYIDQVDSLIGQRLDSKGALETQWSIQNLKLDTLVLRGAQNCLPARVRETAFMSQRTRRELDGNLLEDARNTLIIFQKEVDELERRLIYVKRHTHCPVQIAAHAQDASNHHSLRTKYLKLKLKNLLNDAMGFSFDSDEVSVHYKEKLTVAARYLNQDETLRLIINGHTDARGDFDYNQDLSQRRANKVKDVLVAAGVDAQRMQVRAFGEHLPIDSNSTATGRYSNRQVHVEFFDHHEESYDDMFMELDELYGVKEKHSERAEILKYWPKEKGDEH